MEIDDNVIKEILSENARRQAHMHAPFDPISGYCSIGCRQEVVITGLPTPHMWLPESMMADPWVKALVDAGSVETYLLRRVSGAASMTRDEVVDTFIRLRCQHDFAFWAASYVYIKCKGGGEDCLFRLTYPQRIFVERLEELRLQSLPIRLVLLKARQWGGSTTSQLYMAWLQLIHQTGLNSLIIAHQGTASDEIKDMFDRMIKQYPIQMLYDVGADFKPSEKKMVTVGRSGATFRVPQRNCKVKIGTAERPHSCRGGDYNLVHLSEVGLWRATCGKKPEEIVRAACAGVVYKPFTMIVYESTANGVGNFFHREYIDARDNPRSQFRSLFVSWFDIEQNTLPFTAAEGEGSAEEFARWLFYNRDCALAPSNREESGQYLWWLWQKGATLEGINWYITERAKHSSHGSMAAECPSDDTEAFVNSGAAVFDKYKVEAFRRACRKPKFMGEVTNAFSTIDTQALAQERGESATVPAASAAGMHLPMSTGIDALSFVEDPRGELAVWSLPDKDCDISNRYLVVVDVGGRSLKADWSVIVVFDRMLMLSGGNPSVVAQWYGHCDMDILAWKAVQIAAFYDNALLVIESNTLETHDADRMVDGDQSTYILHQVRRVYSNLYARRQSEQDIRMGIPRKYGFHTNVSTKPMIISTLVKVVREHLYTERDERCLNEMLVYERKPNGAFGAIVGEHDDLLMTRAIGLHICFNEMPLPQVSPRDSGSKKITPKIISAASI